MYVVAASCGGAPIATSTSKITAGGTKTIDAPNLPVAEFGVQPRALGDAEIYTKIRHRVRLAKQGLAYLRDDGGGRVDNTGNAVALERRPMYPVLADSGARLRIVDEEDHARLALWVEKSDAAQVVLAAVQAGDPQGRAPTTAGVWLGAGASIDRYDDAGARGDLQGVQVRSDWVHAIGFVPKALIGDVWVTGVGEDYEASTAADDGKPPAKTGKVLAAPTVIRAAPNGDAPAIAEVYTEAPVRDAASTASGAVGVWTEIEVHLPRVRVRGYVMSSAVRDGDALDVHHVGRELRAPVGEAAAQIHVPPGTCLYDQAKGEVVGVTIADTQRGVRGGGADGWWPIAIATSWGVVPVVVHDVGGGGGGDAKSATLESCAAAVAAAPATAPAPAQP